jgi:phage terminase Nu1 subunit (DNA packaging protein)
LKCKVHYAASRKEIAAFFGVAVPTIDKWIEASMPGKAGERWDLGKITRWARAREEARRKHIEKSGPDDPLKIARAQLLNLKIKREEEASMPVAEHDRYFVRLCLLFKNGLLALAPALVAQLQGLPLASQHQFVRERFIEFLKDLSGNASDGKAQGPAPGKRTHSG